MTETTQPPMQPSNEVTPQQLDLARQQGQAYRRALDAMAAEDGAAEQEAGDFRIAVAAEKAEGMYALDGGGLVWHEPGEANAHVEVVVVDRADGRFVPELDVAVEVLTADGRSLGRKQAPFLWHPFLHHYGHNWKVPGAGEYTVAVHVDAARFYRHDPVNGRRYATPVEVRFDQVRMEPGVKPSPAASPRAGASGPTAGAG